MKRKIRRCVWETNSSMSHSLIIMTADQNKKWEKEKLYYYDYNWPDYTFKNVPEEQKPVNGMLYTKEEVLAFLKLAGYIYNPVEWEEEDMDEYEKNRCVDDFIYETDDDFKGYDRWHESDWEEYDSYDYTTPGGEELVIETKCGRDG